MQVLLSFCTADSPEIHNLLMMINLNIPDMGIFPPDFSDQGQAYISKGEKMFPIHYTGNYRISSPGV